MAADLAEVLRLRDQLERELADHKRKGFQLQYKLEGMNQVINMLKGGDEPKPIAPAGNGSSNGHAEPKRAKHGKMKEVLIDLIKEAGKSGVNVSGLVAAAAAAGHPGLKDTSVRAWCYKQKNDGALDVDDGKWRLKA